MLLTDGTPYPRVYTGRGGPDYVVTAPGAHPLFSWYSRTFEQLYPSNYHHSERHLQAAGMWHKALPAAHQTRLQQALAAREANNAVS